MKLSIIAALSVGPIAQAQSFLSNCTWQTAMLVDSYLGAYCNNDNWEIYSYDWTWFDTSYCLVNSGGQLVPQSRGDYSRTCKGCSVRASKTEFIISCTCLLPSYKVATTTYDLNKVIWNHDGFLGCFEHFGNRTLRGPF
ncbi:hypothetical protein ANO14919_016600 [Xylariales sp. No.14919]|nr:hypothetical protein ANO14919_016600 [Xylariales sp. No.14919]